MEDQSQKAVTDSMANEIINDRRSLVDQVLNERRDKSLSHIRSLAERYQTAKRFILSLYPAEPVPEFGSIEAIDGDLELAASLKIESERWDVVELVEARAKELVPGEGIANRSETEMLRDRLATVEGEMAALKSRQSARNTPRSDIPQMLIPSRGTPPPAPQPGESRKLGFIQPGRGSQVPAMLPALGSRRAGPGSF